MDKLQAASRSVRVADDAAKAPLDVRGAVMSRAAKGKQYHLYLAALSILREQLGRAPTQDDLVAFIKKFQRMDQHDRSACV